MRTDRVDVHNIKKKEAIVQYEQFVDCQFIARDLVFFTSVIRSVTDRTFLHLWLDQKQAC